MSDRSAVIVPIALPPDLRAVRDRTDAMAARGVPPHVTVLFPFLPVSALTAAVHDALAGLVAGRHPFVVRFDQVRCRDQAVWLVPADQSPFLRLTADVTACWPGYPPYGGVHAALIAHLTLVETSDAETFDAACALARESGPLDADATELLVITEDEAGHWHGRWRLPFRPAARPVDWTHE